MHIWEVKIKMRWGPTNRKICKIAFSGKKMRRNLCLQNMGIGSGILIQLLQASKLACFYFPDTDRRHEIPGQRQKTSFLWIQPGAWAATYPQQLSSPRSDAGQCAEHWAPGMFVWQLRDTIFRVFWVFWIRLSACNSAWPRPRSFPATTSPEPGYQVCATIPYSSAIGTAGLCLGKSIPVCQGSS